MRYFLAILFFWIGSAAAQPICTPTAPASIACESVATNLKLTDVLQGMQAQGPLRQNQSVQVPVSTLLALISANFPSSFPIINATTAYQLAGQNFYRIGSTNPFAMWIGMYAGASASNPNQGTLGIGDYALESLNASPGIAPENTAIGIGAAIAATTAGGITSIGTASCSGQVTGGNITCVGNDAGRDYVSAQGGDVLIGTGAGVDGAPTNPNILIGSLAMRGNAGTITIGGSITPGDQLTFTFATTNPCNGTTVITNCTTSNFVGPFSWTNQSVTYTVVGGDTLATIATNVAALIALANVNYVLADGVREGTHNLYAFSALVIDPINHPTVINQHFPSSWLVTTTYSCVGTCGETATITPATTGGNNVVVGINDFSYAGVVNPQSNVTIGNFILNDLAISPQYNTLIGTNVLPHGISPTYNIGIGYNALAGCSNCSENIVIGSWAAQNLTGNGNTILGDQAIAGQNCISSGFQNMELGYGACVPSPTTNYQLSIQNIIYGTGNSGTGATVSTGSIGIGQTAPGARFDVLGTDTSGSTLAFRVQNSTSTTLFSVADDGTVKVGSNVVAIVKTYASTQASPSNPTGTTNTTGVMMGLAQSITPSATGKVLITITGTASNSILSDGVKIQIRYGTGTAPANAAALTGTAVGSNLNYTTGVAAMQTPFSATAVVTGLTLSTAYWLDVGVAAITGGTASITGVSVTAVELP